MDKKIILRRNGTCYPYLLELLLTLANFTLLKTQKSSTKKVFLVTTSKTLEILVPSLTKIFKDNGELTPRSLGATKVFEDE